MKTQSEDTHPEAERILIEGYRKMSVATKLQRVADMNETLELFARAGIVRKHPNAGEREILLRSASRRLPKELLKEAFGWDVDKEGY